MRWLALLVMLCACREEATQLIVVVDSDLMPESVRAVRIEVMGEDGRSQENRFEIKPDSSDPLDLRTTIPFSFGVAPRKGLPAESQLPRIRIVALDASDVEIVDRRVQVGFIKHKTLHLLMFLSEACISRTPRCEDSGLVCDRGECVAEYIPPERLESIAPREAITFDSGPPLLPDGSLDTALDVEDLDAVTPLVVPSIIYPWNGVAEGSVDPSRSLDLVWRSSPGAEEDELSVGNECEGATFPCDPLMASNSRILVGTPFTSTEFRMAPGRYYWRVRSCRHRGSDECSDWSETRYFDFGRTDRDTNLDGADDLVVGAPGFGEFDEGAAFWFPGGPAPFDGMLQFDPPAGTQFGVSTAFAGDLDRTMVGGSPDFVVGYRDGFRVFRGVDGGAPTPSSIVATPFPVTAIAGLGDINGDGAADMAAGFPGVDAESGSVSVFFGPVTASPDVERSGPTGYGAAIAGVGDVNSDGFADFLIGSPGENRVYLFGGTSLGSPTMLDVIVAPDSNESFGAALAGLGDVDGDWIPDFFIGAPDFSDETAPGGAGTGYFVSGATLTPVALFPETPMPHLHFGSSAVGLGDVDGDGEAEFAIGGKGDTLPVEVEGTAIHFVTRTMPTDLLFEPPFGDGFASSMCSGDIDGDGRVDLVVGATNGSDGSGNGAIRVFDLLDTANPAELPAPPDDPRGMTTSFQVLAQAPRARIR